MVNNVRYLPMDSRLAKEIGRKSTGRLFLKPVFGSLKAILSNTKKRFFLNDVIEVKPILKRQKERYQIRIVEMSGHQFKNDLIFLKSKTEWVLIDATSQRPIRISKDIVGDF